MSRKRPSRSQIESVYQRDNYRCQNCGAKQVDESVELHAHHIVPLSDGGTNKSSNLKTLCSDCHKAIHTDSKAPTADSYSDEDAPIWLVFTFSSVYAAGKYPKVLLGIVMLISIVFFAAGVKLISVGFLICSSVFIGMMWYAKVNGSGGIIN